MISPTTSLNFNVSAQVENVKQTNTPSRSTGEATYRSVRQSLTDLTPQAISGNNGMTGLINSPVQSGSAISKTILGKLLGEQQIAGLANTVARVLQPDAQGQIHEEELQYAVVTHLLGELKPEASQLFEQRFASVIGSGEPPILTEDATKLVLKSLVADKVISTSEAKAINGISFSAAQLDSNTQALYDNRGSANDPTIATMNLNEAVLKATNTLKQLSTGELPPSGRLLTEPSNQPPNISILGTTDSGISMTGNSAFLWKPKSERNGNLVVLLPSKYSGLVEGLELHSPKTNSIIEKGRFSGDTSNGNRAHFRFSKPGGEYPDGLAVVAKLKNGREVKFNVSETSKRLEKR